MKKFIVKKNSYLSRDVIGFYHCDYIGYQKDGNPDYINKLKNMTKANDELNLVKDFITVAEIFTNDIEGLLELPGFTGATVCTVPRSKVDSSYHRSQLLFKKTLSSVVDSLKCIDGTGAIKRIKDTKTTHDWRLENNSGDAPYGGITKDTCRINQSIIKGKNIILVDDIYTEGVYVAEDCIQALLDFGAKNVILYTVAKTKSEVA